MMTLEQLFTEISLISNRGRENVYNISKPQFLYTLLAIIHTIINSSKTLIQAFLSLSIVSLKFLFLVHLFFFIEKKEPQYKSVAKQSSKKVKVLMILQNLITLIAFYVPCMKQ